MPAINRLPCTRIVADSSVLDNVSWSEEVLALRIAPDELLLIPAQDEPAIADEYALITEDHSYCGVWVSAEVGEHLLDRHCRWRRPHQRPAFAQGAVAGIAIKIWFGIEQYLLLVPAPYAQDFAARTELMPGESR